MSSTSSCVVPFTPFGGAMAFFWEVVVRGGGGQRFCETDSLRQAWERHAKSVPRALSSGTLELSKYDNVLYHRHPRAGIQKKYSIFPVFSMLLYNHQRLQSLGTESVFRRHNLL